MSPGSTPTAATSAAVPVSPRSLEARRRRAGIVLVAPALLVLLAVVAYPIGRSIVLSLQHVTAKRGEIHTQFTGVANYRALWSDEAFRIAVKNSLIFTLVEVVAVLAVALLAALLLNHPMGRLAFFRTFCSFRGRLRRSPTPCSGNGYSMPTTACSMACCSSSG